MIDGKTLDQHKKALVYLDRLVGGKGNFDSLTNNVVAMDKMISRCVILLNTPGTWVYNYPLTPQYDVYHGEDNCFEIYLSPLENNIVMLTVNDIRFDSRNYDLATTNKLKNLWAAAQSQNILAAQKASKEVQR